MKIKALNSFKSAELLVTSGDHYNSMAAQCAYYSGLQIAMALVMDNYGKSRDELDEWYEKERAEARLDKKPSSHVFYINKLYTALLRKTGSKAIASDFKQKLFDLKTLRVNAVYYEIEITSDDVKDALNKARILQENVLRYMTTKE